MVIFYKKWKNYNEIQLTKNKMDLNRQKMTNYPPSHELLRQIFTRRQNKAEFKAEFDKAEFVICVQSL